MARAAASRASVLPLTGTGLTDFILVKKDFSGQICYFSTGKQKID